MENLDWLKKYATPTQFRYIEAFAKKGSARAAADSLGCNRKTVQNALKSVRMKAEADGYNADIINPLATSPVNKPNPPLSVTGTSTLVGPDGEVKQQWIKTKTSQEERERLLLEAIEMAAENYRPVPKVKAPRKHKNKDLLNVFPLGDPHIGMLSWPEETGDAFDCEIAERLMLQAVDWLVESAPDAETAFIDNLGDFFHSDNQSNRTTRSGHQLDVDGRWAKVLMVGYNIMIRMVERCLEKHKRVIVRNVIGNHDDHTAMALSVAMGAAFRHNPRVTIEQSPSAVWRMVFGKCLIATTHGDTIKPDKLPGVMATDWPEDWGATKHRYWYIGHVHHKAVHEFPGVVVESFRTLAGKDAWHSAQGYRSGRDLYCITLHKEFGEIGRSLYNVSMFKG